MYKFANDNNPKLFSKLELSAPAIKGKMMMVMRQLLWHITFFNRVRDQWIISPGRRRKCKGINLEILQELGLQIFRADLAVCGAGRLAA